MSKPYREVAIRLKNVRNALRFSQGQFGLLIFKSRNSIVRYEGGNNEIPDDVLNMMRIKAQINTDWLLTGNGSMFLMDMPIYTATVSAIGQILSSYPGAKEILHHNYPEFHKEIQHLVKAVKDNVERVIKNVPGINQELPKQVLVSDAVMESESHLKIWGVTGAGDRFEYNMQETDPEALKPIELIQLDKVINSKYLDGFKVSGDSMVPGILDGAYIAVNFQDKHLKTGRLFVLNYPHEGLVVKAVQVKKDRIKIYSYNDNYEPEEYPSEEIDENIIVGRVMWIHNKV